MSVEQEQVGSFFMDCSLLKVLDLQGIEPVMTARPSYLALASRTVVAVKA